MKRSVLIFSVITYLLLASTACSNSKKDTAEVTRHEKYIDAGTHNIRLVISDLPSDYTIILEAGGGRYSDVYEGIQDTLAKLTGYRVISYDRSGFGMSELGPADLNAPGEVQLLEKCIDSLKLNKKIILVGHSYGGFLIQLFTKEFPDLVKGLVLIDPMNVSFVERFGLDNLNALQPYFTDPAENWQKAGNRMVDNFPVALDILRGYELPPDIPAVLITSGNAPIDPALWRKCHEEMVMNSPKHKLVIAEGNSHDIMTENPYLVLNTVVDLVNTIKSK